MVIGPFINAGAVVLGGVLGAVLSQRLPERIRVSMPSIFGLAYGLEYRYQRFARH